MTYLTPAVKRRPIRRRRSSGLGGFSDIFDAFVSVTKGVVAPVTPSNLSHAEEVACLNQANAKVAPLDARIGSLANTWRPNGFYTPDQISAIVAEGMKIGSAANDAVRAAPNSTGDAVQMKNQALKTVWGRIEDGKKYTAAATEARAKGVNVVNAPGLRDWALSIMRAASDSLVTAAVFDCQMSWFATIIIKFQQIFDVAAAVFRKIVGVIVTAGETVLDVVGDLPQIWTVVKWGGLAAIGLFAVLKISESAKRGR